MIKIIPSSDLIKLESSDETRTISTKKLAYCYSKEEKLKLICNMIYGLVDAFCIRYFIMKSQDCLETINLSFQNYKIIIQKSSLDYMIG